MGIKHDIKRSLVAIRLLVNDLLKTEPKKPVLPEATFFYATVNCMINGVKTMADCIVRITKKGKIYLLGNDIHKDIPRQFSPGPFQFLYWKDSGLLVEHKEVTRDGRIMNYDILVVPKTAG